MKIYSFVVTGLCAVALLSGCRSEENETAGGLAADGSQPDQVLPVQGPGVDRCRDELAPKVLSGVRYEIVREESSKAGCVLQLEAVGSPEIVSALLTESMKAAGYVSTGVAEAKGGQRLSFSGQDGLAASVLLRGSDRVPLQLEGAESGLELHWYNPVLM